MVSFLHELLKCEFSYDRSGKKYMGTNDARERIFYNENVFSKLLFLWKNAFTNIASELQFMNKWRLSNETVVAQNLRQTANFFSSWFDFLLYFKKSNHEKKGFLCNICKSFFKSKHGFKVYIKSVHWEKKTNKYVQHLWEHFYNKRLYHEIYYLTWQIKSSK